MNHPLTIKDLMNFIEGNANNVLSSMNIKSESFEEQVEYRKSKCPDCIEKGKCTYCGCSLPGRFYTTATCNRNTRFPDIMSDEEWVKFKEENNEEV